MQAQIIPLSMHFNNQIVIFKVPSKNVNEKLTYENETHLLET